MSTEITVVVGADSLLKSDQSTRNARRRDRLDSEALRDQVKVKAQEDDKSKGFNNKKDEYDPSRDPAAHARKKDVSVGGFTTCNIRQIYSKESVIGDVSWSGVGGNWSGGKFMDIKIKAIKEDGTFGNEVEFTFNRNRLDPTFYVDQADLGVNVRDLYEYFHPEFGDGGARYAYSPYDEPTWNNYYGLDIQRWKDKAYGPEQSTETPRPNCYMIVDNEVQHWDGTINYEPLPLSVWPGGPSTFEHYSSFGEDFDYSFRNNSYSNQNRYFSLGSSRDIQNTLGRPGFMDPGYQLFMLPLNNNHAYLVFLFTDVAFSFRGFAKYRGTMSPEIGEEGLPPMQSWNDTYYYGLNGTRKCEPPVYYYPTGFKFENNGVQLNDEALSKIQQVKIVELKDGVAKIIPDDKISASLKSSITVLMPLDREAKQIHTNETPNFFSSGKTIRWFWDNKEEVRGPMNSAVYETDDNVVYKEDVLDWYALNTIKYGGFDESGMISTMYVAYRARERSLAKGYGFGYLETSNHFDSVYVENYGYPFHPESGYLANDVIFTPAVYAYFSGLATPSIDYDVAYSGIAEYLSYTDPDAAPKRFISIDYTTKEVSSIKDPGSLYGWDILTPVDSSLVSTPQEMPIFQRASHYAWNWDNPEFCWQRLIDMGFTAAMIGPKPKNPTNE